jgi:hypothetical protein
MVSKYKLASDWDGQDIQTRYATQPASSPPVIETLSSQRERQSRENVNNAASTFGNIAMIIFVAVLGVIAFNKIFNNSSINQPIVENPAVVNHEASRETVNTEVEITHKEAEKAAHKAQMALESTHHSKKNAKNSSEDIANKNEEKDSIPTLKSNSISEDKEIYQTMDQLKSLTK